MYNASQTSPYQDETEAPANIRGASVSDIHLAGMTPGGIWQRLLVV